MTRKTLKEVREETGIKATEIANKVGCTTSALSSYESGSIVPPLEDLILINQEFNYQFNWSENIREEHKQNIVENMARLSTIFPIQSVLTFASKSIRSDMRYGDPGKLLDWWTQVAGLKPKTEMLLLPDVKGGEQNR